MGMMYTYNQDLGQLLMNQRDKSLFGFKQRTKKNMISHIFIMELTKKTIKKFVIYLVFKVVF